MLQTNDTKISIITVCYNSQKTIEKTIESVIYQSHQNVEYIIIDGSSKDDTLNIIKKYQKIYPIKLISEPDAGIYDAMNKGINMVTGEIIGILNSDDFYKNNKVLSVINKIFQTNNIDAVYADLEYIDPINTERVTRKWISGPYNEKKIANGWIFPHPTFFVKKETYSKYGKFNLKFKIAADYELMLRFIKLHKIKVYYLPQIIVSMRNNGTSGLNFKQRRKGWKELKLSWTENKLQVPFLFLLRRIIFKIKQYL